MAKPGTFKKFLNAGTYQHIYTYQTDRNASKLARKKQAKRKYKKQRR